MKGRRLLLTSVLFSLAVGANAQMRIKGKITDGETGEALPGVTLVTQKGESTISDGQGNYSLFIPKGDTLRVSYVGFEPLHIPYRLLTAQYNIRLKSGVQLNEVTVTASIASVRNAKAIGADVDNLNVAQLMEKSNAASLADLVDGRVSGVQMYQSNGKVGMPIRFNMRSGATLSMDRDPLIYVDGIRYNNSHTSDINSSQDALSALNDLVMDDIQSIDIIKGPAAASSYGAEAANGVIVITTKRGLNAQKGKIDVNVKLTHGINQLARKYDQFVNNDAINHFFQTGQQSSVYANLSTAFGRGNQLYFSVNNHSVEGIVPGNKDERRNLRMAYDFRQGAFSFAANAAYTHGNISLPQTAQGKFDAIWNLMRTQEPWGFISEESWRAQSWTYDNDRLTGGVQASYLFPLGIKLETNIGMDVNYIKGTYLLPYGYLVGTNDEGSKNISNRRNSNLTWDIKLNKQFDLGNQWKLTATLLSQALERTETINQTNVTKFVTDVDVVSAGLTTVASESTFQQRTWGLYGELFFNYANRLFINAGLRRDASNLIGDDVASIYYPSLSLAYNLKQWKLRAAYGESGRLPYPDDATTFYTISNKSAYGPYITLSSIGNSDIRPERTRELELGADFTTPRHQFALTGYAQLTSDAIVYQNLISSNGTVGQKPINIGKVKGFGAEFSWNGKVWQSAAGHALQLFATVNYQTNEVVDTGFGDLENLPNILRAGLPTYAFYESKVIGAAYNDKGEYLGAVKEKEKSYLGKPFPDVNGSVGFDLTLFKHLTVGAKLSYAFGASVYNQSFYNVAGTESKKTDINNLKKRVDLLKELGGLTPNTDAYRAVAELLARTERERYNYIEPADFVRLSSLSVGYDFSPMVKKATKGFLKSCKLNLTGQNLWLWTNYSGAEPQIEGNGGTRQTRSIGSLSRDITNAPAPRSFVASLSLSY